MATREQIQQAADLLTAVTRRASVGRVPLADFPVWLDVLGVDWWFPYLCEDGRVGAQTHTQYEGCWIAVNTYADVLHGVELPPTDSGEVADRMPLSELHRLELLSAVTEGAA